MEYPSMTIHSTRAYGKNPDDIMAGSAETAHCLSRLLSLTRTLYRQSLYYHWQVMETGFVNLHSLFEQHCQSLRKASDIIADRIHVLGYATPELPAWGTHTDDARPPGEMINSMLRGHQACAREAKNAANVADAAGDDMSGHLAAQRYVVHDRAAHLFIALVQDKDALIRSAV